MGLSSSVLSPPPIPLKGDRVTVCAMNNNIYLYTPTYEYRTYEPPDNGIFSLEEVNRGFFHYKCELNEWFPVCKRKFGQRNSCIIADRNLLYSIGGVFIIFTVKFRASFGLPYSNMDGITKE